MWDRLLVQLKQGTFSLCGQQKQLIIPQYARHILHSIWWMEYMQSGQVGCRVSDLGVMAIQVVEFSNTGIKLERFSHFVVSKSNLLFPDMLGTSCIPSDEWSICNQVSWVVKFSESGVHKNLKYLAPCQFTNYGSFLEAHSFLNLFW